MECVGKRSMKINKFEDDLKYSLQGIEYIDAAYRNRYALIGGGVVDIKRFLSSGLERNGIDVQIILKSGQIISVQEKRRRDNKAYLDGRDILIEVCSVCHREKNRLETYFKKNPRDIAIVEAKCKDAGWIDHIQSNIISYAFDYTKTAYVYDTLPFQLAWRHNKALWFRSSKNKLTIAQNERYVTIGIAVNRIELETAMNRMRTCAYNGLTENVQKTFSDF